MTGGRAKCGSADRSEHVWLPYAHRARRRRAACVASRRLTRTRIRAPDSNVIHLSPLSGTDELCRRVSSRYGRRRARRETASPWASSTAARPSRRRRSLKETRARAPDGVAVVKTDLTDPNDVAAAVSGDLDVVFHLVAYTDTNYSDRELFEDNIRMTHVVLAHMRWVGVDRFDPGSPPRQPSTAGDRRAPSSTNSVGDLSNSDLRLICIRSFCCPDRQAFYTRLWFLSLRF